MRKYSAYLSKNGLLIRGDVGGGIVSQRKTFRTMIRSTALLLMLLLIGFECIPDLSGGDAQATNEAALQLTRSQILVNAAYTLEYRPAAQYAQAMRDLKSVLPVFEQEQTALQSNPAVDVQSLLQEASGDYLALITGTQIIIAHPKRVVDPLEVNILVLHEHNYLVTMNALVLILPRHAEDRNIQLFVIQIVIQIVFLLLILFALATQLVRNKALEPVQDPFVVRGLIVLGMIVLVLCALIGQETVPLGIGNDLASFSQATLQRTRCEVMTKSALVLAYRSAAEKTPALSDLQIVLPLFQQEQATLLSNGNTQVHRQVLQAAAEYQMMSEAAQAIIAQSDKSVDPAVVNTIVSQAPMCVSRMNNIVAALQNQMEQQTILIFQVEVAIEGVLLLFFGTLLFLPHDLFVSQKKESERAKELTA